MQTEIDHFLKEQNNLLMQRNNLLAEQNEALNQQVNSLKTILTSYSEVEQKLQDKISTLESEKQALQALISTLKSELFKIEQGSFSQDLQQNFQTNLMSQLETQLTQALSHLNLSNIVNSMVNKEFTPIRQKITAQQTDLEQALLKLSQLKVSTSIDEDLRTQDKRLQQLETMLGNLILLIKDLKN
jgi:chromosome segregation ATPase